MYDTSEEANQKLRHSVVLLKSDPVYIQISDGANKNVSLTFNNLKDGSTDKRCIWDKDWNFRDLGSYLGYANFDLGTGRHKEASYLSRMPVRQCSSTQGVCQRNLHIPPLKGSARLALGPHNLVWQGVYNTKPFVDMFSGKYPSFEDVKKEFEKNSWLISKAFTKEFAVRRADVGPFFLQYKGKDVGHSDDLYKWKVAKQFKYLEETMDHIKLKVA